MTKRAAIYCRVSTEEQDRYSPKSQERECREAADKYGIEIVTVIRDVKKYRNRKGKIVEPSGEHRDRPGFQQALQMARDGQINVIIVWDKDRLYRGLPVVDVIETRKEADLQLFDIRGEFNYEMLMVEAGIAYVELEKIRRRTVRGQRDRMRSGKLGGGDLPLGYVRDESGENGVIDEVEAKIVRLVVGWYAKGVSYDRIKHRLDKAGLKARRKKTWSRSSIEGITQKLDRYGTGTLVYVFKDEVFTFDVEPIISKELYNRALVRREANRRRQGKTGVPGTRSRQRYLLGGKVRCDCGWFWTVKFDKRYSDEFKSGAHYRCTKCFRAKDEASPDCPRWVGLRWLDSYVWRRMASEFFNLEKIEEKAKERMAKLEEEAEGLPDQIKKLEKKIIESNENDLWTLREAKRTKATAEQIDILLLEESLTRAKLEIDLADFVQRLELFEKRATEALFIRQTFAEIVSEQAYLLADLTTLEELEDGSLSGVLVGRVNGEIEGEKVSVPLTIVGKDVAEKLGAHNYRDQYEGDWVEATREAQYRRRKEIVDLLVETVHLKRGKKDEPVVDIQFRDILSIVGAMPMSAKVSEQVGTP